MTLAWGAKLSPADRAKVRAIAAAVGCDPSWLMAIMYFESRLNPAAVNAQSGASGLIQCIRSTAAGLGYTLEQIRAMPIGEQLDKVVRPYFLPFAGRLRTLSDAYMAVLWPAAVGRPEDHPLFVRGTAAYSQNAALDTNGDGIVTKAEASAFVARALADGLQPQNATLDDRVRQTQPEETMPDSPQPDVGGLLGGLAGTIIGAINPIAGILVQAFGQKIAKRIEEKVGVPGVADELNKVIIGTAQQATGRTDELEAVAVARQDPATMAKVEEAVQQRLDALAPILDRSAEWDAKLWAAQVAGRKASSEIAIAEHAAGLWDMTRVVVYFAAVTLTILVGALLAALIYQAVTGTHTIDSGLLGLAGPIFMAAVSAWGAIIAYRFDGTKESSEQTKALNKSLDMSGGRP